MDLEPLESFPVRDRITLINASREHALRAAIERAPNDWSRKFLANNLNGLDRFKRHSAFVSPDTKIKSALSNGAFIVDNGGKTNLSGGATPYEG